MERRKDVVEDAVEKLIGDGSLDAAKAEKGVEMEAGDNGDEGEWS